MSNPSTLSDFASFASALRQTNLPGTQDRQFLQELYGLASRRNYLETDAQQELKATAFKYQPLIRAWRSVLKYLMRAQKNLADAQNLCEKRYPGPFYWKKLFHPAEESLSNVSYAIQQTQQLALAHLHPLSLKKQERTKWRSLLQSYSYDYPLGRLGSKPVETWLFNELDNLFSQYFKEKKVTVADRNRLIQAVMQAAFGEKKELDTIKVAISRIRKRGDRARVK